MAKSFFQAIGSAIRTKRVMSPVGAGTGWTNVIRESFTGAWQQNEEVSVDVAASNHAVYSCVTLIANDVGKLRPRVIERKGEVWDEVSNPAYDPVLRKPNRYQNYIQFQQWWITSKLFRGNAYGLKERDARGMVRAIYILDPNKVLPMVATDGSIWYQLGSDNLSGIQEAAITVPASEIIHDRMNCLFHPLVGISPLFASALSAQAGNKMQDDAVKFFSNGARPGGILTAAGAIGDATAARLKEYFETNFTGENRGKIAVVGDGLKFESLRMTSADAQLIEQLQYSATVVCSAFHVPPFKIQIGTLPAGMKVGDLNQIYYADCLQSLIEEYELSMIEGLGMAQGKTEVNLDLEGLLRTDPAGQADILTKFVSGSIMTPNEGRNRVNLPDIAGGDTVYLQVQNYSLEALAKRDSKQAAPETKNGSAAGETPTPDAAPTDPAAEAEAEKKMLEFVAYVKKGLSHV